jgi:hypothetical protein
MHFARLFQIDKRDNPISLINSNGWTKDLEDYLQRALRYLREEHYISTIPVIEVS